MLQLCRNYHQYIENFTIYGERSSGTKFLEKCIKAKFGLQPTWFYGWKHFFGWTKPETITYRGKHTLFLCIVRSPYEWLLSMKLHPHHVPQHNQTSLRDLLYNEWYSIQQSGDEIKEDRNFTSDRKNPAKFKNLFELRNVKNRYLSETMPIIAQNFVLFSYDSFLVNRDNYLNIIANRFDLKITGKIPPPVKDKKPKEITSEHRELIDHNLDWSLENSLGFFQNELLNRS
jgi:hypothetical protein